MTTMTTGQRIAAKRKELGLSQEGLGEQLGVSRQAIYKWESDASLPDIDKLVALSRLFQVSVGWLLGVEDTPEAPADTITDRQAEIIEDIFRKYQQQQPAQMAAPEGKPVNRMRRRILLAVGCTAIAALGIFGYSLQSRLKSLQGQYSSLSNSVSSINGALNSQVGSLTSRIEAILEEQNSLIAGSSTKVTNVDLKAGKVTFALSATPKAYTDQTRALFHLENGTDTLEAEGQRKENGEFRAELVAPLTDDITLSVTFVNGEDRQVQTLGYYSRLYTNTLPQVEVYSGEPLDQYVVDGQLKLGKDERFAVTVYWVYDGAANYDDDMRITTPAIQELKVGLFRNKKLVQWLTPVTSTSSSRSQSSPAPDQDSAEVFQIDQSYELLPLELTLDNGDELSFAAVVTDELGRTCVWANSFVYSTSLGSVSEVSAVEWGPVQGYEY